MLIIIRISFIDACDYQSVTRLDDQDYVGNYDTLLPMVSFILDNSFKQVHGFRTLDADDKLKFVCSLILDRYGSPYIELDRRVSLAFWKNAYKINKYPGLNMDDTEYVLFQTTREELLLFKNVWDEMKRKKQKRIDISQRLQDHDETQDNRCISSCNMVEGLIAGTVNSARNCICYITTQAARRDRRTGILYAIRRLNRYYLGVATRTFTQRYGTISHGLSDLLNYSGGDGTLDQDDIRITVCEALDSSQYPLDERLIQKNPLAATFTNRRNAVIDNDN